MPAAPKTHVTVESPTVSGAELIRLFFGVVEKEARVNPRLRRALIAVLCSITVAIPTEERNDIWETSRSVPW
jgi:hypothetical protein